MPNAYEGSATVTISALYLGCDPVEVTTGELHIVLQNAGVNRARIQFPVYLKGPEGANVLRVQLPDGLTLQGRIEDGLNGTGGGWLEFTVEAHDLGLARPADLSGWRWQ
ncbi:hypothetical protein BLL42_04000 [Pseudomonas frederiksbergensis]|uniref:Uncharacterized protein n=1 Tax=Pseudomonas frederiksbergensis TaxID=104087 RepID=A0A1J0EFU6_9PSED|nr:hypothetical protein [Pseudomonas frederiksbergensis]APC14918.1 hypothetical protein BLL42_04000 [Pseudomonas frederiksbergensis]